MARGSTAVRLFRFFLRIDPMASVARINDDFDRGCQTVP